MPNIEDSVSVVVRVRPVDTEGERVLHVDRKDSRIDVGSDKSYYFDHVYSEDVSQTELYEEAIRPAIQGFIRDGNHATIFAYGQTGAGKTFTMGTHASEFDSKSSGIIPRAIKDTFDMSPEGSTFEVNFFEIYNEQVFDLLNHSKIRVPLCIKEEDSNFVVSHLSCCPVTSDEDVNRLLRDGIETRSKGRTAQNNESSRSHAIFTFIVTRPDGQRHKLSLVDLAGSESLKRTKATGQTLFEGLNINKSLLALGNVVEALCARKQHVPFRDSSLTKILRESLQSTSCLTTMIACVSPMEADLTDTFNTLRYADRAKSIRKRFVATCPSTERKRKFFSFLPPVTPAKRLGAETPFKLSSTTIHSATPLNSFRSSRLEDLDLSSISSHETSSHTLSPLLRRYKDDIEQSFIQQVKPLLSELSRLREDIKAVKVKKRMTSSPIIKSNPSPDKKGKKVLEDVTNTIRENQKSPVPMWMMEQTLGINSTSPILFGDSSPIAKRTRRSTLQRRNTLMKSEIQPPRRSIRLEAKQRERNNIENNHQHPIDVVENWKITSQKTHQENILRILNSGNMKVLQALPAVGPKSAMILHSFRDLHGPFQSLSEVANVAGLSKAFYKKFISYNQIIL